MTRDTRAGLESARDLGFDPDRLSRLAEAVERDTGNGLYDGAVFLVGRGGRVVMRRIGAPVR